MSAADNLNGTIVGPFQARFGVPAGMQPPEAERQQWEQLCRELLQEREQLRSELARTKREREDFLRLYSNKVAEAFTLTKEEVLARVDLEPYLFQVIAELGREPPSAAAGTPPADASSRRE